MAYSKKTWKDRITEYPNRRELTHSDSSTELVTVARSEGTISQEGDAFSAQNMNDLEGRIDSEFSAVDQNLQDINDNLAGFKFYPSGTSIVGLISDDSAYTDSDGNYVIWGTETAEQLVEDNPNTYKSVPSEEDLRGEVGEDTAKSFGGTNKLEISQFKIFNYSGYTTPKTDIVSYTFTQSGNFKGYLPCYITATSVIETFYLYRNGIETTLGTQNGQGMFTFDINNVEYGETITIRRTRNNQDGQSTYTYLQFIKK